MPDLPTPQAVAGPGAGPHLVCVGASVRALACAATRAGWRVHAADLFGDRDLLAEVTTYTSAAAMPYPHGLADAAARFPVGPWCYTGALENHPELIDRIAAARPLAGNPGSVVRRVRDPMLLGPAVCEAGLGFPDTFASPAGLPADGSFLRKPRASAGGRDIAPWHGGTPEQPERDHVWQRRVDGDSWAVALLCERHGARPWGFSRQLVGCRWCHAGAFAYCGSIAVPDGEVPAPVRDAGDRLGAMLVTTFGIVGLCGVDLVVDRGGHVHVIEVNPRPTASMELVDRARGVSHAAAHLAACALAATVHVPSASVPSANVSAGTWGKAVLFAAHDVVVGARVDAELGRAHDRWSRADGWPAVADVPCTGTRIDARRPLVTLFARGDTGPSVRRTLRRRAAALTKIFSPGESTRF
jgi:predicted ATP-grasp superfamily ATP-dependent carboligase